MSAFKTCRTVSLEEKTLKKEEGEDAKETGSGRIQSRKRTSFRLDGALLSLLTGEENERIQYSC